MYGVAADRTSGRYLLSYGGNVGGSGSSGSVGGGSSGDDGGCGGGLLVWWWRVWFTYTDEAALPELMKWVYLRWWWVTLVYLYQFTGFISGDEIWFTSAGEVGITPYWWSGYTRGVGYIRRTSKLDQWRWIHCGSKLKQLLMAWRFLSEPVAFTCDVPGLPLSVYLNLVYLQLG